MEITLDGQPMFISLSALFILILPGILYILYVIFVFPKLYHLPQKYIENKYQVKFVFRWRFFTIEGNVTDFQKFYLGLLYVFLMFLIAFTPVVILGLFTFFLQDQITLTPL